MATERTGVAKCLTPRCDFRHDMKSDEGVFDLLYAAREHHEKECTEHGHHEVTVTIFYTNV